MSFFPEYIILIAVVIIVAAIYLYSNSPKRKAEKLKILKSYRRTQNLSMKLQDTLSSYILIKDAYYEELKPGITFGNYLRWIQEQHEQNLSEAVYLKLRNGNSSRLRKRTAGLLKAENKRLLEVNKELEDIMKKNL
ncbi:hypothetical protein CHU92_07675 [Flavobacterium cyanobacteriorum]|uniref:Uncharacterized protein n=1 Tax=Flavobacterium cyanobacteriorum TaxID=2022802 RepID=A0A255Z885_9FLAO|nr:hypothetical protein [Flavobacterium cyanobacteriorum]OYQ37767.1 hypothetical protein CHU92_07675 [Flavobacterium cyanobacteriorum]